MQKMTFKKLILCLNCQNVFMKWTLGHVAKCIYSLRGGLKISKLISKWTLVGKIMEDVRQKKRKNWKSLIPRTLMGSLSISWKMSRSKCSLPFSIFNKVIKIDWKILFTVKVNTTGYGIILAMTCKIAVMLNDHFIYPLNHFVQNNLSCQVISFMTVYLNSIRIDFI